MPADVAHELDVAARLLVAALLGAAIGLEREIHDHPAGMRTHLLVALGSALFTVISIFGFVGVLGAGQSTPVDPSRVAAQVVTAIGMAAGAADYVLAVVGTAIVVFSLWPLNWVEDRIHGPAAEIANMRLELRRLDAIGRISDAARTHRLDLVSIDTQRLAKGRYEVALQLRVRSATSLESFVLALGSLADVDILESGRRE